MKKIISFLVIVLALFTSASCDKNGELNQEDKKTIIEIESSNITLVVDNDNYKRARLSINVTDGGKAANELLTYKIADEKIIGIEDGSVYAKSEGKTEIEVSANGQKKKIEVNVLSTLQSMDIRDDNCVKKFGRTYTFGESLNLTNTASGFEVNFIGTSLTANIEYFNSNNLGSLKVLVDGIFTQYITYPTTQTLFKLADGLDSGLHTVKVLKMTEQGYFKARISNLVTDGQFLSPKASKTLKFEFYGDSITSGYGNLGADSEFQVCEDGTRTYATMLGERFNAEVSVISYAGVPACLETPNSTFTMIDIFDKIDESSNVDYDFNTYQADIVFLNLGTNDSNSKTKTIENMRDGYAALLRAIREKRPDALILCVYGMMEVEPLIEDGITSAIDLLVSEEGYDNMLYFSLPSDLGGLHGHPTIDGHKNAFLSLANYLVSKNFV